ncbi:MAG: superoxide dismutase [Myxococcales bacterium]|nr:superoxide dismutase [Myxococcales bacterium]
MSITRTTERDETSRLVFLPTEPGKHTLPILPYDYAALEPFIDAETMKLHHTKHQQAYVDGLNKAELALKEARQTGNFSAIAALERQLAFHGSGHANHLVFFNNLRPKEIAKTEPEGELAARIQLDFGDFGKFKDQFTNAALTVEGSGWGALVYDPTFGRLYTMGFLNHQNLNIPGAIPLLLVDVWEHAYYLKYQNRRADYLKAWWNVVDWKDVEQRFEKFFRCTI